MSEKTLKLLEERKFIELGKLLKEMNPADIAIMLDEMPREDLPIVFRLLSKDVAADTFVEMEADKRELLIQAFSDIELKEVMDQIYLDDTVDIIEEMPANVVKRILKNAEPEMRKMINQVLNYPKDSAGSLMTIEYIDLKKNMTVSEAFDRIKTTGVNKETIYTCYVTNDNRKLEGLVSVRTLLLSDKDSVINDIMEKNIIYVDTLEDKEVVAKKFSKYNFIALPVVDQEKRLVGIVTFDDAMDVIQEENSEDFAIMAGMNPIEESYLKTSVWAHSKKRITWLLLLMLSATVTGTIITKYEDAFASIPLLVAFIPMLMDTGGNCGSQSSTMIIRGLAIDEIQLKDFFRVMWKESRISLLVGSTLALVNGIRILVMYKNPVLALVVGLTLMCTVLLSKTLGCILPMCAKKLNLDPAIMAAPLITTIVDTCSVLVYFNIAMHLMNL